MDIGYAENWQIENILNLLAPLYISQYRKALEW